MGFFEWDYTPSFRGYDSYFGYWLGAQDYWNHTTPANNGNIGYDFRNNTDVYYSEEYSDLLHMERMEQLLDSVSHSEKPFFINFCFQLVHAPYQVPKNYSDLFNSSSETANIHQGMVLMADTLIGRLISKLKSTGLWDSNLILVLMSDNGGQAPYHSNWPLRGGKRTLWEGGVRVPTWVYGSPDVISTGRRGTMQNGIYHITDWFPTFLSLAGESRQNPFNFQTSYEV